MSANRPYKKSASDPATKKALILEAARAMGKPRFTPAEIEQIRRQLMARLGARGNTGADYIMSVLKEAGLRVAWSTRSDADDRYAIVIPAPEPAVLEGLIERFESETFGVRAGGALAMGESIDAMLEGDLARRGADAYHQAFPNYYFCAICGFGDGSLVVLSEKLWASEVIRRVRPVVKDLKVEVRLPV